MGDRDDQLEEYRRNRSELMRQNRARGLGSPLDRPDPATTVGIGRARTIELVSEEGDVTDTLLGAATRTQARALVGAENEDQRRRIMRDIAVTQFGVRSPEDIDLIPTQDEAYEMGMLGKSFKYMAGHLEQVDWFLRRSSWMAATAAGAFLPEVAEDWDSEDTRRFAVENPDFTAAELFHARMDHQTDQQRAEFARSAAGAFTQAIQAVYDTVSSRPALTLETVLTLDQAPLTETNRETYHSVTDDLEEALGSIEVLGMTPFPEQGIPFITRDPIDAAKTTFWDWLAWWDDEGFTGQIVGDPEMRATIGRHRRRAMEIEEYRQESDPIQRLRDTFGDKELVYRRHRLAGEIGHNLYDSLASGELWRKGWEGQDSYLQHQHGFLGGKGNIFLFFDAPMRSTKTGEDATLFGFSLPEALRLQAREGDRDRAVTWNLYGADLVRATLPTELAVEMAQTYEPGTTGHNHYMSLSTPVGQEIMGLALEVALDPIWLAGPAGGSVKIAHAGRSWTVSQRVAKAASAAARFDPANTQLNFLRSAIDITAGATKDAQRIGLDHWTQASEVMGAQFADEFAEATRILNAATASSKAKNRTKARRVLREVLESRRAAQERILLEATEKGRRAANAADAPSKVRNYAPFDRAIQRGIRAADRSIAALDDKLSKVGSMTAEELTSELQRIGRLYAREASITKKTKSQFDAGLEAVLAAKGHVTRRPEIPFLRRVPFVGSMQWSVPFSKVTHNVIPEQVINTLGSVIDMGRGKAGKWFEDSMPDLDDIITRHFAGDMLTPGEMMYAATVGVLSHPSSKVVQAGKKAAGGTASVVRALKNIPHAWWDTISKHMRSRLYMPMFSKIMDDAEVDFLVKTGRLKKRGGRVKMESIPPEQWESYTTAYRQFALNIANWDRDILRWGRNAGREAAKVHRLRQQMVKDNHPSAREEWGLDTYTVQDVINEAAVLHERGGNLKLLSDPDFINLVEHIQATIKHFADNSGEDVARLQQIVAQWVTRGEGDPIKFHKYMSMLDAALAHARTAQSEIASSAMHTKWLLHKDYRQALRVHDETRKAYLEPFEEAKRDALRAVRSGRLDYSVYENASADLLKAQKKMQRVRDDLDAAHPVKEFDPAEVGAARLSPSQAQRLADEAAEGDSYFNPDELARKRERAAAYGDRESIVYMSPDEFLSLAKPLPAGYVDPTKGPGVAEVLDRGDKFSDIPFLEVDEAGKIYGHEGRHRSMALRERGVKQIPVRLRSNDIRWNEQLPRMKGEWFYVDKLPEQLTGQDGVTKMASPFYTEGPRRGRPLPERSGADAPRLQKEIIAQSDMMQTLGKMGLDELVEYTKTLVGKASEEQRVGAFALIESATEKWKEVGDLSSIVADAKPKLPPIKLDKGDKAKGYALADYERELMRELKLMLQPITDGGTRGFIEHPVTGKKTAIRDFTEEDVMFAAMTVLREWDPIASKSQKIKAIYDDMVRDFGHVIGQRMGEIPEDIKPLVAEMASIFKSYEGQLTHEGKQYVMSPVELMRRFGVINYVPHISKHEIVRGANAKMAIAQMGNKSATPAEMASLRLNAAQRREIVGTIDEINAKVDAGVGFDVNLPAVMARYMAINRQMSGSHFLHTGLSGGFIQRIVGVEGKTMAQVASEGDWVPLSLSRLRTVDEELYNLMVYGSPDELAASGLTPDVVKGLIDSINDAPADLAKNSPQMKALKAAQQRMRRATASGDEDAIASAAAAIAKAQNEIDNFVTGRPNKRFKLSKDQRLYQSWAEHSPELRKADDIELAIIHLRGQDLRNNVAPTDLKRAYDTAFEMPTKKKNERPDKYAKRVAKAHQDAWETVAQSVNGRLASEGINTLRFKGKHLDEYFNPEHGVGRLYIKRQVAESLNHILNPGVVAALGRTHGISRVIRAHNWTVNVYKTIMTVPRMAFQLGNLYADQLTNIIDVGVYRALHPINHVTANTIARLYPWVRKYGSIENAIAMSGKEGMMARDLGSHTVFLLNWWKKHGKKTDVVLDTPPFWLKGQIAFLDIIKGQKPGTLLKEGIDLGDGQKIPLTEAILRLEENNVLFGGNLRMFDGDTTMMSHWNASKLGPEEQRTLWEDTKTWALRTAEGRSKTGKTLEYIVAGAAFAGTGIPMWLPRTWGSAFAEGISNHSRMVNFLGNMERYGSWKMAADHVQKYLFDYSDLSGTRRRILRQALPFFTFRIKNLELHASMLYEKPWTAALYDRMFHEFMPAIQEGLAAEAEGRHPVARVRGGDLMEKPEYTLPFSSQAIPGSDHWTLMKVRTGQEAAMEEVSLGLEFLMGAAIETIDAPLVPTSAKKRLFGAEALRKAKLLKEMQASPLLRFLSSGSFLLKILAERATGDHLYYQRPLREITSPRHVMSLINFMSLIGDAFPLLKPYFNRENLKSHFNVVELVDLNTNTQYVSWQVNAAINQSPFGSLFSSMAAATGMSHMDLLTDRQMLQASDRDIEWMQRNIARAQVNQLLYGFRTKLMDPQQTRYYNEREQTEALRQVLIDLQVQGLDR